MINRNSLVGLIVLLAGLAAGYMASLGASRLQDHLLSDLHDTYIDGALEDPSIVSLSTIYDHSGRQFSRILDQGSEAVTEAARLEEMLMQKLDSVIFAPGEREQMIRKAEMALDLLRLKDFHSQFFMHYFRWLDTGDPQSSVQYKPALGQYEAALDYLAEKYKGQPLLTPRQEAELRGSVHIAGQTDRTIRWARVAVMVFFITLLMGIPRMIRDRGYKRFAASLLFDSLFRPNRISDLTRWHSLQRMASLLIILYLSGQVIFTSFSSWRIPVIFGTLGLIPVISLTALSRNRKRWSEMVVSYMAPRLAVIILLLVVVAKRGTIFFWYRVWSAEQFRMIMIALLTMLLFRKIHINIILTRKWNNCSRTGAAAMVLMAMGLQLLVAGILLFWFGSAESLSTLNSELMFLPAKLFTTITGRFPWLMITGFILTAASFLRIIVKQDIVL